MNQVFSGAIKVSTHYILLLNVSHVASGQTLSYGAASFSEKTYTEGYFQLVQLVNLLTLSVPEDFHGCTQPFFI